MQRAMAEDYRAVVARLRAQRGMTLEDVAFEARTHAPNQTVSLSLIQKRLAPGSTNGPSVALLEALARALDVPPETFAEYRLAKAREELDESVVGLDAALATLDQITHALRRRAAQQPAIEVERQAKRRRKPKAIPDEPPNAQEDG